MSGQGVNVTTVDYTLHDHLLIKQIDTKIEPFINVAVDADVLPELEMLDDAIVLLDQIKDISIDQRGYIAARIENARLVFMNVLEYIERERRSAEI